jgi:hypothetical protein
MLPDFTRAAQLMDRSLVGAALVIRPEPDDEPYPDPDEELPVAA